MLCRSECRTCRLSGVVACADCLVSFRHSSLFYFFNLFINCLMHNNVISNNYMRAVFMVLNEIIYMLLIDRFMHTKWMNRLFKFQMCASDDWTLEPILERQQKGEAHMGQPYPRICSAVNNILMANASWRDLQFVRQQPTPLFGCIECKYLSYLSPNTRVITNDNNNIRPELRLDGRWWFVGRSRCVCRTRTLLLANLDFIKEQLKPNLIL